MTRFSDYRSSHGLQLTSCDVCPHSSPKFHPSLLRFRYFLLKWYWYLFYTESFHTLLSSLCYSPSWPPQQIILYILIIIPHHCGIPQKPCKLHWVEHSSLKLPHQLKLIPSEVPSVLDGILPMQLRSIHITSFSNPIYITVDNQLLLHFIPIAPSEDPTVPLLFGEIIISKLSHKKSQAYILFCHPIIRY